MNPFKRVNRVAFIFYFISVRICSRVLFEDIVELSYEVIQYIWFDICLQYISDMEYELRHAEACVRFTGVLYHICDNKRVTLFKM